MNSIFSFVLFCKSVYNIEEINDIAIEGEVIVWMKNRISRDKWHGILSKKKIKT